MVGSAVIPVLCMKDTGVHVPAEQAVPVPKIGSVEAIINDLTQIG